MGFWSAFALGAFVVWAPALLAMSWLVKRAPQGDERMDFSDIA